MDGIRGTGDSMESALQALLSALTDGAAGPVGQDLARKLVEFLALGERGAVPQPLRDRLGQLLTNSPDTARALGAAMEKLRPGSAALVGGDHIDFDGLFLGDVTGAVLHQHFHPAPAPAEPDPIAVGSLPPATPSFTGRKGLLRRLDDFLRPAPGPPQPGTVTAAVLAGMAGVGKTALATEAAHAAKDKGWFPGGFLFIDLHGHDHATVAAEQALGTLLEDLGTPAEHLTTQEQRVNRYRSQLDQWPDRVLIFADNAASPEQVRPLLPADSRHRILITSRTAIPQLGAHHLPLGQLSPKAAVALLDQALRLANGTDLRITAEADAALELAGLCGYLPLALQIAAAQLVWDPNKPVAEAVSELRDQRTRLAFLDDGERSVQAAFDLSYQRLTAEQAGLLRMLAEAPGPETGAEMLAALLGGAPRPGVLAALERAYLVDRSSSRTEWRLHDLVRVFATQVAGDDPACVAERGDARERALTHYLGRADEADNHLRGISGEFRCFANPDEALGWLDKERLGLLAAVEWGVADRYTARALDLALCLTEYLRGRGLLEEVLAVNRLAREYAARLGDRLREATAWQNAGDALASSRPDEAIEAFGRAGDLHRARGDRVGEATQWNNRAIAEALRGELDAADEAFRRALALRRMAGDLHGEAMVWNNLAVVLRESGREAEAFGAFAEAGKLLEGLGDRERASETYQNLGRALEAAGREEEAAEAFARGRAVMES
ncbi:tetratricopeptide repeat protein [Streptomyces acidiscabies]|uniref:tetratricopeptide repeat protein n=1 Tax=Streptomyces acidiscabies TaxID=42234 RepID=UPI00096A25AC|nr:tetratricopeptide repeat protein [Streptomyces acidiscabies]